MTERSSPAIRHLTLDHLDAALGLSSTAGWNQARADWHMLLTIAPKGSFAAVDGPTGRTVGTSIGIDYQGFGWIAMMLVDPEYRGRGLGARLLEAAMDAVPAGLPIRLDATPMGRPLYERYGFADEAMLTRYVADAGARRPNAAEERDLADPGVRPVASADLATIAEHDRQIFGGSRPAVVEWAAKSFPQYSRIASNASRAPQYCLGRQGRLFDQVGPIVADDDMVARALLGDVMLARSDRAIVADVYDAHQGLTAWLRACGFRAERPLYRMCRQGRLPQPQRSDTFPGSREFAIFGPEFG